MSTFIETGNHSVYNNDWEHYQTGPEFRWNPACSRENSRSCVSLSFISRPLVPSLVPAVVYVGLLTKGVVTSYPGIGELTSGFVTGWRVTKWAWPTWGVVTGTIHAGRVVEARRANLGLGLGAQVASLGDQVKAAR